MKPMWVVAVCRTYVVKVYFFRFSDVLRYRWSYVALGNY